MNFKKFATLVTMLVVALGFASGLVGLTHYSAHAQQLPTDWPSVYIYPQEVVADVNELVTVSVVVFNLTSATVPDPQNPLVDRSLGNLYGFEIQLSWNQSLLEYINHTVTVPVEDYPVPIDPSPYAGCLHEPVFELKNNVTDEPGSIPESEPETLLWVAYSSWSQPPEVFNGNGTLLTITFRVIKEGGSLIKLVKVLLSDDNGEPLLFHKFDGLIETSGVPHADFTFWPDVAVKNKPVMFNASTSTPNGGKIVKYKWDFGDGNTTETKSPIINHTYSEKGTYLVSLVIVDSEGTPSTPKFKSLAVVDKRDVSITSVYLTPQLVRVNTSVKIIFTVENNGEADENCTVSAYYKETLGADWTKIAEMDVFLTHAGEGRVKTYGFTWNTTDILETEIYYDIKVVVSYVPYEENIQNNIVEIEKAVFITFEEIHDIAVSRLDVGWNPPNTEKYYLPVLSGEKVSFNLNIKNNGTEHEENVHVVLICNGSAIKDWNINVSAGQTKNLKFSKELSRGFYNVTITVNLEDAISDANPNNNLLTKPIRVIATPVLNFTYKPTEPIVNQTVIFDASSSYHAELKAEIVNYEWRIYPVGSDTPEKVISGPDKTVINYTFKKEGKWRVVLYVRDNYGVKYEDYRPATTPYKIEKIIEVKKPTGWSTEFIIAMIATVIIILMLVIYYIQRRRKRT